MTSYAAHSATRAWPGVTAFVEEKITMRGKTFGLLLLLLGALVGAGCSSSTSQEAKSIPAPTVTPIPSLPSAGTVSATISSVGPLSARDDSYGIAADDSAVWV